MLTTQDVFSRFVEPSSVFTDIDKEFLSKELPRIKRRYDQWHRKYHNWNHVVELLNLALVIGDTGIISSKIGVIPDKILDNLFRKSDAMFVSMEEAKASLFLSILYHDVIYVPTQSEGVSERLSTIFFLRSIQCLEGRDSFIVRNSHLIIQAIKDTEPFKENITSPLSLALRYVDQWTLFNQVESIQGMIISRLAHEYRHIPFQKFVEGRIEFIRKWGKANNQSVGTLIDAQVSYAQAKPTVGVYLFEGRNAFHMGHWSAINQAMKTFNRVMILLQYDTHNLQKTFPFIEVRSQEGKPLSDIIQQLSEYEIPTLVKPIRNQKDLEFQLFSFDCAIETKDPKQIIPTVFIPVEAQYRHINQKMVEIAHSPFLGNLVASMQDFGYSQEELDEMLMGNHKTIEDLWNMF